MTDIFISYAKKDRSRVEPLAKALEERGWIVWWDPIIPTGKDFDEVIEEELSKARCVIVIWTKRSVKSKYVKGEAREALNRDILVPIEIESGIKPPFDFRSIQTLSLVNWDGSDSFPGFQKLLADIITILGEPPVEEEKRKREEAEREAEKERRRKEKEELRRKSEEEERKRKEAEEKRKFEEEQKRREVKEEIKPDKPEPAKVKPPEPKPAATVTTEPKSPEPRKTSNALKFAAVAGVIVLLMIGVWWYFSGSQTKKQLMRSTHICTYIPQQRT